MNKIFTFGNTLQHTSHVRSLLSRFAVNTRFLRLCFGSRTGFLNTINANYRLENYENLSPLLQYLSIDPRSAGRSTSQPLHRKDRQSNLQRNHAEIFILQFPTKKWTILSQKIVFLPCAQIVLVFDVEFSLLAWQPSRFVAAVNTCSDKIKLPVKAK